YRNERRPVHARRLARSGPAALGGASGAAAGAPWRDLPLPRADAAAAPRGRPTAATAARGGRSARDRDLWPPSRDRRIPRSIVRSADYRRRRPRRRRAGEAGTGPVRDGGEAAVGARRGVLRRRRRGLGSARGTAWADVQRGPADGRVRRRR